MKKFPSYKGIPLLGSSVGPEKISLTVASILTGLVPYIGIINGWFGTNLEAEGLMTLSKSIPAVIMGVWALISTLGTIWGIIRKFFPSRNV